jgi:cysteine desulfurase / selenocysteine lyase
MMPRVKISYKKQRIGWNSKRMAKLNPRTDATFDGAIARRDFPVFQKNKNVVFLDTAASAQKPQAVIDALQNALTDHYANIHRGLYQFSQKSTADFEAARSKVADFIGAQPNEIVFTRNGTESINLVAATWGRQNLKAGDEILITALEHHANIVPWQLIAKETGAKLVVVPITKNGDILASDIFARMTSKTKLMAISHMSNALGTILPVMDGVVTEAKKRGITTLLDGCQAVMHIPVDVKQLECDFYVFSGHKLYGPSGVGVLYGREALLNAMPPYQGGGDMIEKVAFESTTFKTAPARFEAGTPAIAEVIALGAAIDYLNQWGVSAIAQYEEELYRYALEKIATIPGLTLHGNAMRRASILSFTVDWGHPSDIAMVLDKENICVRVGHHCCMPLMKELGVTGTIRASLGMYNTGADVDALIAGLEKARKLLS